MKLSFMRTRDTSEVATTDTNFDLRLSVVPVPIAASDALERLLASLVPNLQLDVLIINFHSST